MKNIFLIIILVTPIFCYSSLTPRDFFAKPDTLLANLSPDGNKVAILRSSDKGQVLELTKINKNENNTHLLNTTDFFDEEALIQNVSWVDNKHLALESIVLKKGVKHLLDTKSQTKLLIVRIDKNSKTNITSVRTSGKLVDSLPSEPKKILYAKSGPYSKVYKIDVTKLLNINTKISKFTKIDGGQFKKSNEIISIKGFVTRWFFDQSRNITAATAFVGYNELELSTYSNENPTTLKKWTKKDFEKLQDKDNVDKLFFPVALHNTPNTFYSLDLNEENERSIYLVNFKSNTSKLVYKTNAFKIVDLVFEPHTRNLIGVKVLDSGKIRYEYHAKTFEQDKSVDINSESLEVIISQFSPSKYIYYSESHNQPGHFGLNINGKRKVIGSLYPNLLNNLNSSLVQDSVLVEDLSIPYILSTPNKSPSPLIVLPHGGPIGIFDNIYFDSVTQFLTYHGFAVLRVNYRGSSGYSEDFEKAGKKQWGALILKDILEATKKVISRQDIAEDSVCIMGMSYGGYAATMLTIQHPELFKCGVNISGVSDLAIYLNSPYLSEHQAKWASEYIGNYESEFSKLNNISPIFNIHKLKSPLYIAHGKKDRVVDVEHAYRLKHLLKRNNKNYEFKVFEESGHNFSDPDARIELFSSTLKFLKNHIK